MKKYALAISFICLPLMGMEPTLTQDKIILCEQIHSILATAKVVASRIDREADERGECSIIPTNCEAKIAHSSSEKRTKQGLILVHHVKIPFGWSLRTPWGEIDLFNEVGLTATFKNGKCESLEKISSTLIENLNMKIRIHRESDKAKGETLAITAHTKEGQASCNREENNLPEPETLQNISDIAIKDIKLPTGEDLENNYSIWGTDNYEIARIDDKECPTLVWPECQELLLPQNILEKEWQILKDNYAKTHTEK